MQNGRKGHPAGPHQAKRGVIPAPKAQASWRYEDSAGRFCQQPVNSNFTLVIWRLTLLSHGRNAPGITVIGQASVISLSTNDSEEGALLNISCNGVCLTTDKRFQWGQKLALTLKLPWDKPPIEILLNAVKWVRESVIGLEFLDLEQDDQVSLDAFLSSHSQH